MLTYIGLCAGEIWRFLDHHEGKASLKTLYDSIEAPKETILMAIGWLGREGYILIDGKLPKISISLNTNRTS